MKLTTRLTSGFTTLTTLLTPFNPSKAASLKNNLSNTARNTEQTALPKAPNQVSQNFSKISRPNIPNIYRSSDSYNRSLNLCRIPVVQINGQTGYLVLDHCFPDNIVIDGKVIPFSAGRLFGEALLGVESVYFVPISQNAPRGYKLATEKPKVGDTISLPGIGDGVITKIESGEIFYESSVPICNGDSNTPMFNSQGEIIGLHSRREGTDPRPTGAILNGKEATCSRTDKVGRSVVIN